MSQRPPEPVVKIITAIVDQALSRCDREGIPWETFYAAMQAEQRLGEAVQAWELVDRIFARIKREKP